MVAQTESECVVTIQPVNRTLSLVDKVKIGFSVSNKDREHGNVLYICCPLVVERMSTSILSYKGLHSLHATIHG